MGDRKLPERDERIAELTRSGHTAAEIAARLNITARTVVRARIRTGTARRSPARFTEAEIRLAEQLLADGASFSEVGRTLHRFSAVIANRFPGRSTWTHSGGVAYRNLAASLEAIPAVINHHRSA